MTSEPGQVPVLAVSLDLAGDRRRSPLLVCLGRVLLPVAEEGAGVAGSSGTGACDARDPSR